MDLLEANDQHRAVGLREDGWTDLDPIVGPHSEEESVESCMVEFAQGQTIRNNRASLLISVRGDVSRIEQLAVPQATKRATLPVGTDHPLAERYLVQPTLNRRRHV